MTMTAPPTTTPIAPPPARRRLLRTQARWIAGTTLLVVLGAAAFSFLQTPAYEATAEVVVLPLVTPNVTPQSPSMGTEQSLATSDLVAGDAARKLGMPLLDLQRAVSVTVPAQTQTLAITCTTTDAAFSARCAQTVAESYVAYKDSQPIQTLPERGRVITPAVPPLAPATPNLVLNLLAGLLVGLVLGFLVAVARDRLDSRVRVAEDLEQRGVRVLGVVPARGAGAGGGSGTDARARAFGALAVKVRSAVREPAGTRPAPVIVVTAIADEDTLEAPAVASALASALAAAGERVVAVNADTGSPTGTAPAPGLLDLLAGRLDLASALHPTAHPQLRTLSVGRRPPARIGGPEWARTAELLGSSADLVVVAADPMLLSANGLTVAQGADAVVAVAVGRATTRSDVDAFVQECRELGLPLAGAALTVDTVRRTKQADRGDQAERDGWGSWAEVLGSDSGSESGSGAAEKETEEPAAETAAEEPAAEEPGRATTTDEEEPVTVQTGGGPRVVPTTVVSPRKPSPLEGNGRGRTENNGTGVHPVPPA
jgi:polysaccharide biosynthesis transport protein